MLYGDMTSTSGAPMHRTQLRKVGGAVMLAVPPAFLERPDLKAGDRVDIGIEDGRLVVAPTARPRYTLDELRAQCGDDATLSAEDRA